MIHDTPRPGTTALARADVFNTVRAADRELMRGAAAIPAQSTLIASLVQCASIVDDETTNHVHRVARYARSLAQACGWKGLQLEHLTIAATLHDIGKIGVSRTLLSKPGRLTQPERAAVERHTTLADSILRGCMSPLMRMTREVATHHHEHWDGRGYPLGLKEANIPLAARFVALADVYDALTSDRPYRTALPRDSALAMIAAGSGAQFDPALAASFLAIHEASARCA